MIAKVILIVAVSIAAAQKGNQDKPGTCPNSLAPREGRAQGGAGCEIECSRDGDCRQNLKCCSTYCGGRSCAAPVPQDTNNKPGQCGANISQLICRRECEKDSDCRGNHKCCRTTCGTGTKCSDPIRVPSTTTTTTRRPSYTMKPGTCTPGITQFNCNTECQRDGDCRGTLKCCPTVCGGRQCSNPQSSTTTTTTTTTRRPGSGGNRCPVPSEHPGEFICRSSCSSHSDCRHGAKCCANKCGAKVCTPRN